jgi:hypothetical protein
MTRSASTTSLETTPRDDDRDDERDDERATNANATKTMTTMTTMTIDRETIVDRG